MFQLQIPLVIMQQFVNQLRTTVSVWCFFLNCVVGGCKKT
jgi:hypothetical protein